MIRVSPRRSRPRRLITALRIVSATIGASSCRSSPRNLISRCPLISRNWVSGFISPVSALVEAGRGSSTRYKISVVSGVRAAASTTSNDVRRLPGMRSVDSRHLAPVTDVAADVPPRSRTPYSSRGASFANLIPVSVQASTATSSPPTQSKIIKVL